jgi:hypothetical protein
MRNGARFLLSVYSFLAGGLLFLADECHDMADSGKCHDIADSRPGASYRT